MTVSAISTTTRAPLAPRVWVNVAVLTALSALGLLGFASSFGDLAYLLAGVGGLVVGTGAALIAAYFRLDVLVTSLVVVAAYFLFGSGFAMPDQAFLGFLPNLETLSGLVVGAVFGWADIVTLSTPVAAPDYIAVLPYVAAWLVGVVSATLAARWFVVRRRTAVRSLVGLLGPVAIYVTGVLTGTEVPHLAALRGIAFAVIALVWLSWRQPTSDNLGVSPSRAMLRSKLAGIGVIALGAILVGSLVGVAAAPTVDDRFVLREKIEPPFDPLQYPSPLAGFRTYTKDLAENTLFTVDGLKLGERIRLATMDAYDGTLWNVTGPAQFAEGSGAFRLIAHDAPPPVFATAGDRATLRVTIEDYKDYWLPGIAYAKEISFDDSAGVPSTALRYNTSTGIAVVTTGVRSGMTYTMQATTQEVPSDEKLKNVPVANVDLAQPANVPDIIAAKATELAGDAATPIERLRAIETALHLGYLSHGAASSPIPSSAGHGADRMKLLFDRNEWIGDDEQFASAFALMARSLGYPARVVIGFAPDVAAEGATVEVKGSDVRAWVEVAFGGVGWLPFYPSPEQEDVPQDQTPQPKTEPQPQVRQPPRSDPNQEDLVSAVELDKSKDDDGAGFEIPGWVWGIAAIVGIPVALYFVPLLVIAALKKRRRARRRTEGPADRRAAGAWDELVDTYAELGYAAPRKETRLQLALGFEQQFRDELDARQSERSIAADRADSKAARAEAKTARTQLEGATDLGSRLSSAIDATVVRAKETAAWRPGVNDDRVTLPAIPGLREFAVRADEAVFSGALVPDDQVESLWTESLVAVGAARSSVSWFRRQLSKFRMRSKRDVVETLTARLNAAVPPTMRGALTR